MVVGIPPADAASDAVGVLELEQIASLLRTQDWIKSIDVVASAKVPVAKLALADADLRMDISIENVHTRLGIEASRVVRDFVAAIPALHPLMLVLKQFLREKGLNNTFTGGVSSYAVVLMCVHLLQRQDPGATGVQVTEVGQWLLRFLEYYGMTFDYDPVYADGRHNVGAGAFAIARVISALENAFYALSFHRSTQFTPSPLCQLIHRSGHEAAAAWSS